MFYKFCIAAGLTLLIMFLVWLIRGLLLTPVPMSRNMDLTMTLRLRGACPELESTVNGLVWLIKNGTVCGQIVLRDDGLDEESRRMAELLAKDYSFISLEDRAGE